MLCRAAPEAKLNDIKALLGKMLFSGAGMEKKVEWLSGGEKARLALAKFMLTQVRVMVLCSACVEQGNSELSIHPFLCRALCLCWTSPRITWTFPRRRRLKRQCAHSKVRCRRLTQPHDADALCELVCVLRRAGSVIAVSHDRYFLRRIATRIVTVDQGKLVDYQGDYEVGG